MMWIWNYKLGAGYWLLGIGNDAKSLLLNKLLLRILLGGGWVKNIINCDRLQYITISVT